MAVTEALKRATKAYIQKNIVTINLRLNRSTDAELIAFPERQPNKNGYLKELIKKDMAK